MALGMEGNVFIEGDPDLRVEDVTVATRPSFTIFSYTAVSRRPMAEVIALRGAIVADTGAAPSSRCNHNR